MLRMVKKNGSNVSGKGKKLQNWTGNQGLNGNKQKRREERKKNSDNKTKLSTELRKREGKIRMNNEK